MEAFVDALDLSDLGFARAVPAETGRPGYHPAVLLKLYLYGYSNRGPSSRRLEREAGRNLELVWLTGRLAPDFKTIADFRRDNSPAIQATWRQFVLVCRKLGLFNEALVAIDGSEFKAVNARDRNYTAAVIQRRMEQVDGSIARYLSALDTADRQEPDVAAARIDRLQERLVRLREQMRHLREMEQAVKTAPDGQISLTPPGRAGDGLERQGNRHSRLQRSGGRRRRASPDRGSRGHQPRLGPRAARPNGTAGEVCDRARAPDGAGRPRLLQG